MIRPLCCEAGSITKTHRQEAFVDCLADCTCPLIRWHLQQAGQHRSLHTEKASLQRYSGLSNGVVKQTQRELMLVQLGVMCKMAGPTHAAKKCSRCTKWACCAL